MQLEAYPSLLGAVRGGELRTHISGVTRTDNHFLTQATRSILPTTQIIHLAKTMQKHSPMDSSEIYLSNNFLAPFKKLLMDNPV